MFGNFSQIAIQFKIPSRQVAAFKLELGRIVKKIEKLKYRTPSLIEQEIKFHQPNHDGTATRFINFDLHCQAPFFFDQRILEISGTRLFGYRFLRETNPECSVCGETTGNYCVLARETYAEKTVCQECIPSFIGERDFNTPLNYVKLLLSLESLIQEHSYPTYKEDTILDLRAFLAVVCWQVEHKGWVGQTQAGEFGLVSTADCAYAILTDPKARANSGIKFEQRHFDIADSIIEWAWGVEGEGFRDKIAKLARSGGVDEHEAPTAAAMLWAWNREYGNKTPIQPIKGSYLTTTEESGRDSFILKVLSVESRTGRWGDYYRYLCKAQDGSRVICNGTKEVLIPGNTYQIRGTIKKKADWTGDRTTILGRIKEVCLVFSGTCKVGG